MTGARKALGKLGEDVACEYLERQGWQVIARNWRTRRGEIDVVARDGEWLVFVEVRARRASTRGGVPRFGPPDDSVTARKQLQLAQMAEAYLYEMPWSGPWRIDVVALEITPHDTVARLGYYRDAVGT